MSVCHCTCSQSCLSCCSYLSCCQFCLYVCHHVSLAPFLLTVLSICLYLCWFCLYLSCQSCLCICLVVCHATVFVLVVFLFAPSGVFRVESYQQLKKKWHYSGYTARRLALYGQRWGWLAWCQYPVEKNGITVATLPGAWRYTVSAGAGWPGVNILWVGEKESLICNLYLGVAELLSEQIHPWDTLACCWDVQQPTKQTNQPQRREFSLALYRQQTNRKHKDVHVKFWPRERNMKN